MWDGMEGFELSRQEIELLRAAHRGIRDKRLAYRVNAIILLGDGWSLDQVAEALLVDRDTLRRFVRRYREGGLDRLLEMDYRGSCPRLADEQLQQLDEHLSQHVYLRVQDILAYVHNTFGVTYRLTGMTELLHRPATGEHQRGD